MADTTRDDLVALGFLGIGPVYHKDARLSKDVVGTLLADDWDERIDTVTRGILGLTVACARRLRLGRTGGTAAHPARPRARDPVHAR